MALAASSFSQDVNSCNKKKPKESSLRFGPMSYIYRWHVDCLWLLFLSRKCILFLMPTSSFYFLHIFRNEKLNFDSQQCSNTWYIGRSHTICTTIMFTVTCEASMPTTSKQTSWKRIWCPSAEREARPPTKNVKQRKCTEFVKTLIGKCYLTPARLCFNWTDSESANWQQQIIEFIGNKRVRWLANVHIGC